MRPTAFSAVSSTPLLLLLFLSFASPVGAAASTGAPAFDYGDVYRPGRPFRDGMLVGDRLIVFFEDGAVPTVSRAKSGELRTGQEPLDQLSQRFSIRDMSRLFPALPARLKAAQPPERARVFAVDFDGSAFRLADVAAAFAATAGVEHVEPVGIHAMDAVVPNDPGLQQQWWLRNPSAGLTDIRAVAAWYHSTGSSEVIVCDADSGIDWQHPDLGGTAPDFADGVVWTNAAELNGEPGVDDDNNGFVDDFRGWDFVNISSPGAQTPPQDVTVPDNDPMDYGGHGTSTAGCITTITDNGLGVASINWSGRVMGCRIGWTVEGTNLGVVRMDFAAQAMDYARIKGASIYNASWGSSNSGGIGAATDRAVAAGMIVVTAAGNDDSQDASYLAGRSDVIAVAATGSNDAKADFSSFGGWVDISAPGINIYTTGYDRYQSGAARHIYDAPDGTSFSSPIVAGAFALARATHPSLSRAELVDLVLSSVDDIAAQNPTFLGKLGSGRINLAKLFENPMWLVPDQLPTFLDAINTADVGDTVAIVGGLTLSERVVLPNKGLKILGGWDAGFTYRDPVGVPCVLEPPGGTGATVSALAGVDSNTVLDGFVLRGGKAGYYSFPPMDGRYGGGIVCRNSSPVFRNLRIEGCVAGKANEFGAGGAVAVLGGSPRFEDCEFTGNGAMSGSAIYSSQGTPSFRNVSIHDNTSYPTSPGGISRGGAVYLVDSPALPKALSAPVTFDGGLISGHDVPGEGGAIYASNVGLVLRNTTVENNSAGGSGGAIYVSGGSFTGLGVLVRDNQAVAAAGLTSGGGLYAEGAYIAVDSSRFERNSVTFSGAGMSILDAPSILISNNFVVANTGGVLGTAVAITNSPVGSAFLGNTVANNTGATAGANGLYLAGAGTMAVSRNIFAFNGGGGTSLADGVYCGGATAVFQCNTAFSNSAGNYGGCDDPTGTDGNLDLDPGFCDMVSGDYAIATTSPAAYAQTGCGTMGADRETCGTTTAVPSTAPSPRLLALAQNHPNPFNPSTTIAFDLPHDGRVRLRIFDLRGRLVRQLKDQDMTAGTHRVVWNGSDTAGRIVASGTYFCELQALGERRIRKMGLLK